MQQDILHIFNPTFRSWASFTAGEYEKPRLIVKTGFTCNVGTDEWPLLLHNFWVYSGEHRLEGTLEPRRPVADKRRKFAFHDHSRNEVVELPGVYAAMEDVIEDVIVYLEGRRG